MERIVRLLACLLVLGCIFALAERHANKGDAMSLHLETSAFHQGGTIPREFTCDGPDHSPALTWNDPPQGTHSFALIVDDPDAPAGIWVHWVAYNLPATLRGLPAGVPKTEKLKEGGLQGTNDFRRIGYNGPCPPPGKPHRYFFKLYALDTELKLGAGAKKADVETAMHDHVLAHAEFMGTYGR